jgi:para-nitrobenzyl esterase
VPHWPGYTLPGRETMIFDETSRVQNDPRSWERELFARIPYIQPGT